MASEQPIPGLEPGLVRDRFSGVAPNLLDSKHAPAHGQQEARLDDGQDRTRRLGGLRLGFDPTSVEPNSLVGPPEPCPRLWITAPNPSIQRDRVRFQIESRRFVVDQALEAGLFFLLWHESRGAGGDGRDRFDHGFDPDRIELVEIQGGRVVDRGDRNVPLLQVERSRIDPVVRLKNGNAGLQDAFDDLPRQRAASPKGRQKRGVKAHRFVFRRIDDLGRQNDGGKWENIQLRSERELLVDTLLDRLPFSPVALVSKKRPAALFCLQRERIRAPTSIGRNMHAHDLMARLGEPRRDITTKRSLTKNSDS